MKQIKTCFIFGALLGCIIATGGMLYTYSPPQKPIVYPETKFGAYLAAQHALFVNDFDAATKFSESLDGNSFTVARKAQALAAFLAGINVNSDDLDEEKNPALRLIYDTNLVQAEEWKKLYDRRKDDSSAIMAPLRIWSGVASGKSADVLKFIEKLPANDSWKAFARGQILVETNKPIDAAKQFAKVTLDFININDYLYLMSFYAKNNMKDAADKLRTEFTSRPGGMFMLNMNPDDMNDFFGPKQALAFGLIQSVSHNQSMVYSDTSLMLLRTAEIAGRATDATNYYIGQYFLENGGDYKKYFERIDKQSIFYPFARMRIADSTGKISDLKSVLKQNPLFVPAITKLVSKDLQKGRENTAIRILNRALKNEDLPQSGRAYMLKTRAYVYYARGDLVKAQNDIREAADIIADSGVLAIQARIWAAENRELDTAYEYAIALVRSFPLEIDSWDVLGLVVQAKEGDAAALEIWERVSRVAEEHSALFENIGDANARLGNTKQALDAYNRAIDLSGDGLTIVPLIEKKIRKLK